MALALSTRATKLQYSQREYWVEVALRVDENGTCTRRKWCFGWAKVALAPDESGIWGGQKWHLHTEKLHFCGFQGEQRGQKCAVYYAFFPRMGVQVEGA